MVEFVVALTESPTMTSQYTVMLYMSPFAVISMSNYSQPQYNYPFGGLGWAQLIPTPTRLLCALYAYLALFSISTERGRQRHSDQNRHEIDPIVFYPSQHTGRPTHVTDEWQSFTWHRK